MQTLNPPQQEFLDLLRFAWLKGASDIHVEPEKKIVRIRARIDGILTAIKTIKSDRRQTFLENTKSLLAFDMSKYGVAQDSRYAHPYMDVDCRANLVGSLYGEKICLRLLERNKEFSLENYNLDAEIRDLLKKLIKKTQGIIIVSGPTGSGKSTLLYSVLGSIDRTTKAVYTIEDPVEYSLSGLIQIPITTKTNYADALRALMRQDPDVIMVGEIRDSQTAMAAIHAANTGHLVLTTVHANSAAEIFTRFESLGVAADVVKGAALFASAQRLLKKLCLRCRINNEGSVALIEHLYKTKIDFIPKKSEGCESCEGLGIKGRILIFEYISSHQDGHKRTLKQTGSLKLQAFNALKAGLIDANETYGCFND